ncbi:EF-P lysine aminoacylase GenX [PVC group bacterium]|nr:EF-P lysine aminoacylase GenX [PVC group bacterium]
MYASIQTLECRCLITRAIRSFFIDHGFTEVETPLRIPAPALELHIDAEPSGEWFLRTSPELYMKRLLAAGMHRIFQMGPCFRQGECGDLHNPEYTMLEWYRTNADYMDILKDTEDLITHVAKAVNEAGSVQCASQDKTLPSLSTMNLASPWHRISIKEAFINYAGWNPIADFDADRFDTDMVNIIEPSLPVDKPVFLIDYPAETAALARLSSANPKTAERWELYIAGMELANAFSELVDPVEQRKRFEECAATRQKTGAAVYPMDEAFLAAMEKGIPPSGGIALGVDRLVMLLTGAKKIENVLAFLPRFLTLSPNP